MEDNGFALVSIGPAEMPGFMNNMKMKKRYEGVAQDMGIGAKK